MTKPQSLMSRTRSLLGSSLGHWVIGSLIRHSSFGFSHSDLVISLVQWSRCCTIIGSWMLSTKSRRKGYPVPTFQTAPAFERIGRRGQKFAGVAPRTLASVRRRKTSLSLLRSAVTRDEMKIKEIQTLICHARMRNWIFVKVITDQPGLVGWGEATLEWHNAQCCRCHRGHR